MALDTNIHPDLLRTLVAVVECGGFSQAGERLMKGQSAVSLQIKRLESQLGVTLLDRSPRHVSLTSEGEMILDQARRILALNDELLAKVREPEMSGIVRFGAPEDFATSHLPGVLAQFTRAHPKVALEVTCELTLQLMDRFSAGNLDLALVKREPADRSPGLRVWREPLVWLGADRDAPGDTGGGDTIPLVVSPRPCVYRKRMTDTLDAAGRPWRITYTCGSLAGQLAAVRARLGVTVLPKEMAPTDLTILNSETLGLPALDDTEMALIEAPHLPPAAERLRDHIVRQLEHGA
ncbi:MAG: LysR family transcriptional regulator [Alphaproteobacteria bacterium]|nr:LysR family transcriptional regulator [Alphaproteobacteria bacterium]